MFKALSNKILQDVKTENALKFLSQPKRPRKEIFLEWLKDKVQNFCSVTSLHGYVHTVKKEYHPAERWLWIVLSFFALITASVLLWISWNWTSETPTMTVIESTNHPTYHLPFPAITICSINKFSKPQLMEIVKEMKRFDNMTDDELADKLRLLLHFRSTANGTEKQYQDVHDLMELNNFNVNYILERLSPKCNDILERCRWKGSLVRCDSLFQHVNTSEGYCCSFNNHAFPKWNYDQKIMSSIPKQPRRVTACGYQIGLTVLLKPFVNDYFATDIASHGFRVMVHNSYNYADSNSVAKLVSTSTEAYLSVEPESTYSTNDVYDLPPEIRNCLRYNERKMDVFARYSYVNCMAECRTAIVLDACKCVPFNLPNNGTFPKCKMSDLRCVKRESVRFAGSKFQISNDSSENSRNLRAKCNCLPDCTFYNYPSEVSTGPLIRNYSHNSLSFFKDTNPADQQTLIHIFFIDLVSTHYRKDMVINWLGILAAFGGLLGLFLGFSLVTGFELVYFFTIRTFFDKLAEKTIAKK